MRENSKYSFNCEDEMKIPYLTLTVGQQGGIGYPPV
ncbi:unnamed protein product, partial [marine sediment metagenome]